MASMTIPALLQPAPRPVVAAASRPARSGPAQSGPVQPGPVQSGTAQARAVPSGATQLGAAQSGTAASKLAQPPDLAKITKSAQDFESMAINELLKPMFDTVDTAHGKFGGGDGEEAWKPMMVQEFAKHIAASGGLGLAKPVYDAMLRMQEAKSK